MPQILALAAALEELTREGGVAAREKRYRENQRALLSGMNAMGFQPVLRPELQSPIITAFRSPADSRFDFADFYRRLADRSLVIYPGKLSRIDSFRIGTIGRLTPEDFAELLAAIRTSLEAHPAAAGGGRHRLIFRGPGKRGPPRPPAVFSLHHRRAACYAAFMKTPTLLFAIALLTSPVFAEAPAFENDMLKTVRAATKENKMGFLILGREACGNCNATKAMIREGKIPVTAETFVAADLNIDDRRVQSAFMQKYQKEKFGNTLPFVVITDSRGKALASSGGYKSPDAWTALIDEAKKKVQAQAAKSR
ncbi:MAG: hypothetical protein ABMA01_09220 [Chthoniobacteraceae bacterium]